MRRAENSCCTDCQSITSVRIRSGASDFASGIWRADREQIADGLQMIDGVLAEMVCQTL